MGRWKSASKLIAALCACALVASGTTAVSGPVRLAQVDSQMATDAVDFQCPPVEGTESYTLTGARAGAPASPQRPRVIGATPPPPPPPPPPPVALPVLVPPPPALRVESAVSPGTQPLEDASHARQDTELYPVATANPVRRVVDQPVSTFAMETDTAAYANARSFITGASRLPPASAVRVEEFLNYFRYDYPRPSDRSKPFETTVSVAPSPWAPQKQLIHVGLSGYDLTPAERPPLNLVLLVDVSGSMSDESKLPLAKRALRILATRLTARDRVSIVVYAGAAGVALESTPGNNTRDIVCALDRLQAGGSTAGGQGISRAYDLARNNRQREGINRVILLTDGDFNVGISDPDRLKDFVRDQARDNDIYLSVFGFGMRDNGGGDNYNDTMMQALAQNGNGVAAFIDTLSEARRVFDREVSSTLFPIANDVKAQVEFNPARSQNGA